MLVDRLVYRAPCDSTFEEYEGKLVNYFILVDHIFATISNLNTNHIKPNSNEVQAVKFSSEQKIKELIFVDETQFTPWFKLITKSSADAFRTYFDIYNKHNNNKTNKSTYEKNILASEIKYLKQ